MSRATRRDVVVGRTRKPASGRDQVLEHHDVLIAVGLGEPHAWRPHRELRGEVAVEARLGDAHARHVDQLALLFAEGRELHEHARRHARVTLECDACPSGGAGAAVEHRRVGDLAIEHL